MRNNFKGYILKNLMSLKSKANTIDVSSVVPFENSELRSEKIIFFIIGSIDG